MCYFIQSTLSTSHALETLEFSQEQAQSNPIWSRKQGVYLAWACPRSLLRRREELREGYPKSGVDGGICKKMPGKGV